MRRLLIFLLLAAWPGTALLNAAQESGYVYAADQPIPGATVTARQGDTKVVGYTDENGRYVLNLGPGMWELTVEILGLTAAHQQVTVGEQAAVKDFTMEMPKYGLEPVAAVPSTTAATTSPAGTTQGQGGRGRGRGGPGGGQGRGGPGGLGRGGPGGGAAGAGRIGSAAGAAPGPGFQNAQVTATQDGQDALAAAAAAGPSALGAGDDTADQAFLVSGSTSDGLGAASDFERQRQQGGGRGGPGGGGPGGAGDASGLGIPPGMSALDNSNLGLGGLGADAINGGFGGGAAAGGGGRRIRRWGRWPRRRWWRRWWRRPRRRRPWGWWRGWRPRRRPWRPGQSQRLFRQPAQEHQAGLHRLDCSDARELGAERRAFFVERHAGGQAVLGPRSLRGECGRTDDHPQNHELAACAVPA